LAASVDIPAGVAIEKCMLTALRPGDGIPPNMISAVIGRKAKNAIKATTVLKWEYIE